MICSAVPTPTAIQRSGKVAATVRAAAVMSATSAAAAPASAGINTGAAGVRAIAVNTWGCPRFVDIG
jgi:hypothetical protein